MVGRALYSAPLGVDVERVILLQPMRKSSIMVSEAAFLDGLPTSSMSRKDTQITNPDGQIVYDTKKSWAKLSKVMEKLGTR